LVKIVRNFCLLDPAFALVNIVAKLAPRCHYDNGYIVIAPPPAPTDHRTIDLTTDHAPRTTDQLVNID